MTITIRLLLTETKPKCGRNSKAPDHPNSATSVKSIV